MPEATLPVKPLLVGLLPIIERRRFDISLVDGANWRTSGDMASNGNVRYPDNLLSGEEIANVTGKKKSKL